MLMYVGTFGQNDSRKIMLFCSIVISDNYLNDKLSYLRLVTLTVGNHGFFIVLLLSHKNSETICLHDNYLNNKLMCVHTFHITDCRKFLL